MKKYTDATDLKIGDYVKHIINESSGNFKEGDILEGVIDDILDGSSSALFKEYNIPRPKPFALFHIKITTKNNIKYIDELQCGREFLEKSKCKD